MERHEEPYLVDTAAPPDRIRERAARAGVFGVEFLVVASLFVTLDKPRLEVRLLKIAWVHYSAALEAGEQRVQSDDWWQERGFSTPGRYSTKWELRMSSRAE